MISSPPLTSRRPAVPPPTTDLNALKFNAITIIFTTLFAVIFTHPTLTLILGASLLIGSLRPARSPMQAAYRLLGPHLHLHPNVVQEDPRAHHFAQGLGGTFLLASSLVTLAGYPIPGALLGLAVMLLAALNLSQRLCVGCILYYQYRRWHYTLSSALQHPTR